VSILTLAIETSNPASPPTSAPTREADSPVRSGCGVAVGFVDDGTNDLLDIEFLRETGRHDDDLMPAIDRLLGNAGIKPAQLRRVAVSAGPGGFTSVRIAVVTAKMIAEATGASCVAVPSAHVVAARTDSTDGPFAVALAGKGDSAHVTRFDAARSPLDQGTIIDADGIASLGVTAVIADRYFPEPMRTRCAELGVPVVEPRFDPGACLEVSARYPDTTPGDLLPIYPREPEAVRIWRERHGG
jgi:tRNA threonylcarbamoyl adenosine modification protein YeaZ